MYEQRPTSLLVVSAWLDSIPTLRAGISGPELPEDNTSYGGSGFVVISPVGGYRDIFLARTGRPIIQLDCHAIAPDTGLPLWYRAGDLLDEIVRATETKSTLQRILTLPHDRGSARVMSCYPISEPRKLYRDDTSAAIQSQDFVFHWTGA